MQIPKPVQYLPGQFYGTMPAIAGSDENSQQFDLTQSCRVKLRQPLPWLVLRRPILDSPPPGLHNFHIFSALPCKFPPFRVFCKIIPPPLK